MRKSSSVSLRAQTFRGKRFFSLSIALTTKRIVREWDGATRRRINWGGTNEMLTSVFWSWLAPPCITDDRGGEREREREEEKERGGGGGRAELCHYYPIISCITVTVNQVSYYTAYREGGWKKRGERRPPRGGGGRRADFRAHGRCRWKNPRNRVAVIGLNLHLAARKLLHQFTCSAETGFSVYPYGFTMH